MINFKPPRLRWDTIRDKADDFRKNYVNPINKIPVPVEEIIEFKLGIEIVPLIGLKQLIDMEGFLFSDLKTICVDNASYQDERFYKRIRFTLAHELGHLILHSEEIKNASLNSIEDWINIIQNMDQDDLDWFERQANEFAGRLLVPVGKLKELIEKDQEKIESFYQNSPNNEVEEAAITAFSKINSEKFGVSYSVIKTRIYKERIWQKFDFSAK